MTNDSTTPEQQKDFQFPTSEKPQVDQGAGETAKAPDDDAIDQGIAESFPASDPVSVSITKVVKDDDGSDREASDQDANDPV